MDQATIVIEGSLPSVDLALGGAASLQRRSEFRVLFITIAPRRRVLQEPGTPHLEFGERVKTMGDPRLSTDQDREIL